MTELLVLEHTPETGASAFTQVLDARASAVPWRRVDVPSGEALPDDLDGVAGLLVMGGTMSAVDPAAHAWMPPELALLRAAVDADVPVFTVCLGAQLLGTALGGEVTRRPSPEVGFLELTRTTSAHGDEVVGGWPDGAVAFFSHGDEVATLPPGAVALLTGNDGVPAWRVGDAYAVQFHPELTADQLDSWVATGLSDDMLADAGIDAADLTAEARRREVFTVPLGRALLGRWLDTQVLPRAAERSSV